MDLTKINEEGVKRMQARKLEEEPVVEETAEEEVVEENTETVLSEQDETEAQPEEEVVEEESSEQMSDRERALLKEISRLRASRRAENVEINLGEIAPTVQESEPEDMEVTPAEARLFTAWRNEELESLIEKYPQYKTDPKLWERFTKEYSERIPELTWAKRNNVPVSKSLFRERFQRIHRSLQDNTDKAREDGKKELLKAQSAANVMSAGAAKSSQLSPEKPAKKKSLLSRGSNNGFAGWLTKK